MVAEEVYHGSEEQTFRRADLMIEPKDLKDVKKI
jgi:hypothetical protein